VGNDYGYDQIFSRQVEGLGKPGDLFFAISTSGNSPNVLRALESSRRIGMKSVGMTGGSGGKLADLVDLHLNVSLGKTSPRIQEVHITIVHLLVDLLDEFFLPPSNS
jgi:D-sedoheptulose 7-phosphate isomerase